MPQPDQNSSSSVSTWGQCIVLAAVWAIGTTIYMYESSQYQHPTDAHKAIARQAHAYQERLNALPFEEQEAIMRSPEYIALNDSNEAKDSSSRALGAFYFGLPVLVVASVLSYLVARRYYVDMSRYTPRVIISLVVGLTLGVFISTVLTPAWVGASLTLGASSLLMTFMATLLYIPWYGGGVVVASMLLTHLYMKRKKA